MRSSSSFGKSSDSAAATVVTPGWCVVEYEVMKSKRHEHRRDPVVEDTSDEVYINRHRLVELRERYNQIIYELKIRIKEKSKKRTSMSSSKADDVIQTLLGIASFLLDIDSSSQMTQTRISKLEHVLMQLEGLLFVASSNTAVANNARSRKGRRREDRLLSTSSSCSSSSSLLVSSSSNNSSSSESSRCSSRSSSRSSGSRAVASDSSSTTFKRTASSRNDGQQKQRSAAMMTRLQLSKLCACSFSDEDLLTLAQETTWRTSTSKKLKLDECTPLSTKKSQLKQIQNIEKANVEISLAQGKIFHTTKQETENQGHHSHHQPQLDLIRTSFNSFYRRIN